MNAKRKVEEDKQRLGVQRKATRRMNAFFLYVGMSGILQKAIS